MTAKQYKPFTYFFEDIPLIVYPIKDEHPLDKLFDRNNSSSIQKALDKLYEKNKNILLNGTYHIVFVWKRLEDTRMADIWVHNMDNFADPGSGPLIDCFIFKDLERSHDAGIASGDSIVLGQEKKLRRNFDDITEFANRDKHMPEFPEGTTPSEDYYNK